MKQDFIIELRERAVTGIDAKGCLMLGEPKVIGRASSLPSANKRARRAARGCISNGPSNVVEVWEGDIMRACWVASTSLRLEVGHG